MHLFSILFFAITSLWQTQGGVQNITQAEFQKLQSDKNTIVIDVRTPAEIKQGYIKGTSKFMDINSADFEKNINNLDKTKTYVMVCRSGARSGRAGQLMVNKGFKKVYNLSGGLMNWSGPVEK
jgi:rhodanese-related sulfurtransferase